MPEDDDPRIHIRVDSELKRKVGVAAELEGLSTSEFVREQLRGATEHIDVDQLSPAE
ncbi:ribbon-helix-helix protein, CopG family [Halomicroarcula sp. S1AR25-4]|uniref:ribbon-helix-helix protein, CopG family n=1 Tax=Haloarcula sp. S1AR25-4 TaxID=2950538 RepID=UPI002875387B|nr:ribbon-helix-helix protein, CopG family [Halomicroarcula sp. S1AR25-4]MDS0280330.1 ribbon-helix-helix protein, CopG family [Halomicroarcula sp. S1AR25-4]